MGVGAGELLMQASLLLLQTGLWLEPQQTRAEAGEEGSLQAVFQAGASPLRRPSGATGWHLVAPLCAWDHLNLHKATDTEGQTMDIVPGQKLHLHVTRHRTVSNKLCVLVPPPKSCVSS